MDNKSNLPVVFNFGNQAIRTIDKDGEVWFIANDVCAVLEVTNPRQAVSRLDDDERADVISNDVRSANGVMQAREMTIINESGLYSLVLSSRKEQARAFKRWVTHEVLPAIRKTGSFTQAASLAEPVPEPEEKPKQDRVALLSVLGMASVTGQFVQQSVFDSLLSQSGQEGWKHGRWLMSFDHHGQPVVRCIESDALVMSLARLAVAIVEPNGMLPTNVELANLAAACNKRLAQRLEHQATKQNMLKTV